MLDVLVPEVSLQRPRILSGIGQGKSTGVPQHVRMGFDLEPGGLRGSINQLLEVADRHRRSALGHEQEWRSVFGFTVQATQRPQLAAGLRDALPAFRSWLA
jgi:hypothetical protein